MIGPYQLMYWQCHSVILSHDYDAFNVCSSYEPVQTMFTTQLVRPDSTGIHKMCT